MESDAVNQIKLAFENLTKVLSIFGGLSWLCAEGFLLNDRDMETSVFKEYELYGDRKINIQLQLPINF